MSTEDRNRSRRMQSFQRNVSADVTSAQLLPVDPNRVTITFFPHLTDSYTVAPLSAAVRGQGFNMPANGANFTIREQEHGDAIRGAWSVITAAGAATIAVLETRVVNDPDIQRATPGSV